ncbi:MAG TPA: hypothetical protein VMZ91_13205 [Candidatus Paceibacterota bacterium]|nr:hypothetical protein [Candidatus Paceibacterota bacterium]
MERRNFKGLKKYEPLLKTICMVEDYEISEERSWSSFFGIYYRTPICKNNYYELTEEEWEGCLGVACVISVIEGTTPNMFALSKHLDIPHYNQNLQHAFERLRINGVFSVKYDVVKDKKLTGSSSDIKRISSSERERNAWCNIAGIAGGFIGVKLIPTIEKDMDDGAGEKLNIEVKEILK